MRLFSKCMSSFFSFVKSLLIHTVSFRSHEFSVDCRWQFLLFISSWWYWWQMNWYHDIDDRLSSSLDIRYDLFNWRRFLLRIVLQAFSRSCFRYFFDWHDSSFFWNSFFELSHSNINFWNYWKLHSSEWINSFYFNEFFCSVCTIDSFNWSFSLNYEISLQMSANFHYSWHQTWWRLSDFQEVALFFQE